MGRFYTARQNNSGGYFINNDHVAAYLIVEADNVEEAQEKMEKIVEDYKEYCPCCGERWSIDWLDEDDGYDFPSYYGEVDARVAPTSGFIYKQYPTIIHYANGMVEKLWYGEGEK